MTDASPPTPPSRPSLWPGHFELKILAALFAVALLSLLGAAALLKTTLGSVNELTSQHQHQVRRSLDDAVGAYRTFFAAAKEGFRAHAQRLAARRVDHAAELADEPDLMRVEVLEGTRLRDTWEAPPARRQELQEAPTLVVDNPASGPGRRLELTFGIRREIYANFLTLRGAMDQELELDRVFPLVMPRLYRGLALALGVVLVVATVLGLVLARRATRRVAALREASRRVAGGDLAVRIAPRGRDELDELGRAFDRMVGELAETRSRLGYLEKVSAWQEVARRLAHEIKNPLTPIQLAVQQLRSQYKGDDERYRRLLEDATDILGEEVGVIRRLVDDFSALAKLPRVEPTPLDLGAVVRDFGRTPGPWTSALELEDGGRPAPIFADKLLLRRVLANLVENALQAAAETPGGPKVRVSAKVEAAAGWAWLVVEDNGSGVDPARRGRIFDPYFTTKEHGTGLGLAIVRKILLDHGGDITLAEERSSLGGAKFLVRLPLAPSGGAAPQTLPRA